MGSEIAEVDPWLKWMQPWGDKYEAVQKDRDHKLNFRSECGFAKQMILKSDFSRDTAKKNPASVHDSVINSSALGLSLNPAQKHAYLVPREGAICLDISYMGLCYLACLSGAITAVVPVLIHGKRGNYQGDSYIGRGPFLPPDHKYESFHPDRINANYPLENVIGGYCLAMMPGGNVFHGITTEMSIAEILKIRDTSKAFANGRQGKKGPWEAEWSGEMGKKTLLKRAYKSWPQFPGREQLDQAMAILNQHEGPDFDTSAPAAEGKAPTLCITEDQYLNLTTALADAGIPIAEFAGTAGVADLKELQATRYDRAMAHIEQKAKRITQQ